MPFLLDTGVLLRLIDDKDPLHSMIRAAGRELIRRREDLFITTQNIAEFCCVATRPVANNGLGLSSSTAIAVLRREIEPMSVVLAERAALTNDLKRLVVQYNVVGKHVHDARLVAMMLTWRIDSLLTLNERNFRRFEPEGIAVVSPSSLVSRTP